MTISTHILLDIVVAIVTAISIAVAVSNAIRAADVLYKRAQARRAKPRPGAPVSALHRTQTDAGRDLVLR
jgi:hypothetical protein